MRPLFLKTSFTWMCMKEETLSLFWEFSHLHKMARSYQRTQKHFDGRTLAFHQNGTLVGIGDPKRAEVLEERGRPTWPCADSIQHDRCELKNSDLLIWRYCHVYCCEPIVRGTATNVLLVCRGKSTILFNISTPTEDRAFRYRNND